VTNVGALQRERTTAAAGPDRDSDHDRDDDREPVGAVGANLVDLRVGQAAVTDESCADENGDATENRSEIRLVERVDPVDVCKPFASPDAAPLEQ
jgi:hypothetical protein